MFSSSRALQLFVTSTDQNVKHSKVDLQTSSHPQNSVSHLLGLQGPQQTPILHAKYILENTIPKLATVSELGPPSGANWREQVVPFGVVCPFGALTLECRAYSQSATQ